jgi:hypothetical protein
MILTRHLAHDVLCNDKVGGEVPCSRVHGAQALEIELAGVELLVDGLVAVDEQLKVGFDHASNV